MPLSAIAQYVIGILSFTFGIFSVVLTADGGSLMSVGNAAPGVWIGVWIITTGVLGSLVAMMRHNDCLFGIYLVFNVIAAFFSLVGLSLHAYLV